MNQVDPAPLIRELNEFAERRAGAAPLPIVERRPKRSLELYVVGVLSSLTLAILVGFPLGILVALGGARDVGVGDKWSPLIQAHGHLQIVGWVGLFIMGVAFHVLPRFKNTDLRLRALALPAIALVAAGVLLRVGSQPWADGAFGGVLLVLASILELAGALAFAAIVSAMLLPKARKNYDRYLVAACAWFVAASIANIVVIVGLVTDGGTVTVSAKTAPLLEMYLFGFLTLFILGVSIRVLPHFLSLRAPDVRLFTPALIAFNAALLVRIGAGWVDAYGGWSRPDWIQASTAYVMLLSVLAFVVALNLHLPSSSEGAPPGFKGHARLIRLAFVWLVVAVAIEVWFGTTAVTGDFRPDFLETGASRHALGLGFLTQMIFGVGYRVLPVFAGKPLHSVGLVDATFVLLNLAVLGRVIHAVVPWGSSVFRFDHIAVAGGFASLALIIFAYNILRTWTSKPIPQRPTPVQLST
ncbi:MAG: NnrS family protein [Dehalococcoidia bacterium]